MHRGKFGNQKAFWNKKNVLVTGHTGFKGGWLSLWLNNLGASVTGYALKPTQGKNFYRFVYSSGFIGPEQFSDIKNLKKLSDFLKTHKPHVIFHLAAQPLVRTSYVKPLETFRTNTMGVVNLFEAVRSSGVQPVIINVTTDKVYKSQDNEEPFSENDMLGGIDPYAASKTCSEIITQCYKNSYFQKTDVKIATVRAGNVIGGGDTSRDRLIPDYFRSLIKNKSIILRNPRATRPWQHVLEPISGYIKLAEKLSGKNGRKYEGSWNFGPSNGIYEVGDIINRLSKISGGKDFNRIEKSSMHETKSLVLDSSKAIRNLNWRPKLKIDDALILTYDWFSKSLIENDMREFSLQQIIDYDINA